MVTQIPPASAAMAGPIPEYPDAERVVLRDGSVAVIRPLTAGNVSAIDVWFEGLGEETRYARFLAGITRLDDRTRSRFAEVDHWNHEALTAATAGGSIAGIARYIRLPDATTAEVSVAVADRWAGRGIATILLQRIAARAHAAGIRYLTALCLRSNTAILRLLGRLGTMTATAQTPGVVEVRIDLRPASTTAHPASTTAHRRAGPEGGSDGGTLRLDDDSPHQARHVDRLRDGLAAGHTS